MSLQMRQILYTSPIFSFGFLILTLFCTGFITIVSGTKCEPMKVDKCRGMPWTLTHMPNLVHHSSQKNADLVLSQFDPLLQLPGSHSLLFYLCAMFTPMCFQHGDEYPRVVSIYRHNWFSTLFSTAFIIYTSPIHVLLESFTTRFNSGKLC